MKVHNKGLRNLYTSLNIKPVRLSEIKAERTVAHVARMTQGMNEILTHTHIQKLRRENTTCQDIDGTGIQKWTYSETGINWLTVY